MINSIDLQQCCCRQEIQEELNELNDRIYVLIEFTRFVQKKEKNYVNSSMQMMNVSNLYMGIA